jgi:hypothetical protein
LDSTVLVTVLSPAVADTLAPGVRPEALIEWPVWPAGHPPGVKVGAVALALPE